jgi:NADH-quinone oxidoreductase subunit N
MRTEIQVSDWLIVVPEIILLITAMIILMLNAFAKRVADNSSPWIALGGVVGSFISLISLWGMRVSGFAGLIVNDQFTVLIDISILIGTALSILISVNYIRREELPIGDYYALMLLSVIGMLLLVASANLIMVFLSLEMLSIALYVITGFARSRRKSEEAGMKYFLLGSFSAAILLYGTALIYGATGTIGLRGIASALTNGNIASSPVLLAGAGLLLVGLGFKVAVFPFQVWTPDVYEGAPVTVTAFMSVGSKAAAFAALTRILVVSLAEIRPAWIVVVWVIAVLTMTLGNVVAIAQDNIKRMLAYSSIAHAGYIMVAIAASNQLGIQSIPFYLIAYAFMNLGAWSVVTAMTRKGEEGTTLYDYTGLFRQHPILAGPMALFMIALAGLPLTVGFWAKFYVFAAALQANMIGLVIIAVLTTIISAYYYLRVTVLMFMERPAKTSEVVVPIPAAIAITIAAIGTLWFFFFPGSTQAITEAVARLLL